MSSVQQFGKYSMLEKIATGGMAEVWRARIHGMAGFEKTLVVKRILDHLGKDDEFVRLFIDEARIAVSLLHANIVQVFELGEVDGAYYIAMEYMHGLDLSRLASRGKRIGPFPIPLACLIVGEVLKALDFAHNRLSENGESLNIVHCDISPQNILVSFAGEVKLTDFGISRAGFQTKSQQAVVRGQYAYMSPEQVGGRPLDGRSDLFSLAIVLFELVTGRRLFKAKTREETLARVRRAEVPSPKGYRAEVSDGLEKFLLKALSRRAEDRYASAAEMLDGLNTIMVREGFRVSNTDVASWLKNVVDAAATKRVVRQNSASPRSMPPSSVVAVSLEAGIPPRNEGAPKSTLSALVREWAGIIIASNGEIWEKSAGGLLVVWPVKVGLGSTIQQAVTAAVSLREVSIAAGYRLSVGIAPGVARILSSTKMPTKGWELAGPFYLSRWLMNLSAHRGRILITEVGARELREDTVRLGRIPIQGNRFINLHEISR